MVSVPPFFFGPVAWLPLDPVAGDTELLAPAGLPLAPADAWLLLEVDLEEPVDGFEAPQAASNPVASPSAPPAPRYRTTDRRVNND